MDINLDSEQEMWRDSVATALRREAGLDKVRNWTDDGALAPFDHFVAEQGWAGVGVPENLGGSGGAIEQALMFEELGKAGAPAGALLASSAALALLGALPTDANAAPIAALLQAGEWLALAGQADRPVAAAPCRVVEERIDGHVDMVLNAPGAAHLLVLIDNGETLELWLVAAVEGVTMAPRHLIDRTRSYADVTFAGAPAQFLGTVSAEAVEAANTRVRLLLAAEALGLARAMLDMTVQYVGQRVQFGAPVGSFQAVKHAAAEALVEIEASHSGVYYAAWSLAEGERDAAMTALVARAYTSEAAVRTADRCLLLHGAIGYTWDHDLQLFYKRAKTGAELFGSAKQCREAIATRIL